MAPQKQRKPKTKARVKPAADAPVLRSHVYNIVAVVQAGRLQYEAILLAASEIIPFENKTFGQSYPYGNKIEALAQMPGDAPFLFLDTDTLITGDLSRVPFDFSRPTASMKREGTWPEISLYGPGYAQIWKSLYDRFELEFESSLDLNQPDEYWQRYLYFNAGFFYHADPQVFGQRFAQYAQDIRDNPPDELVCQVMHPWLDQVALPLVIHGLGGGRQPEVSDLMDHEVTCHYRVLPLLYARESDAVVELLEEISAPNWIKKVLKQYEPMKRMIFQGKGRKARAMFDPSLSKNTIGAAISSSVAQRPNGIVSRNGFSMSSRPQYHADIGVITTVGCTPLTRILCEPSSMAETRVILSSAAFDDP